MATKTYELKVGDEWVQYHLLAETPKTLRFIADPDDLDPDVITRQKSAEGSTWREASQPEPGDGYFNKCAVCIHFHNKGLIVTLPRDLLEGTAVVGFCLHDGRNMQLRGEALGDCSGFTPPHI